MQCSAAVAIIISIGSGMWLGPGATGFTFMKLGIGARPVGMGQAFTAVADDANALFYNPGGLGFHSQFNASLTVMQMFDCVSYLSGGFTTPIANRFAIGLGGGFLSATDIRRDNKGQEIGRFGLNELIIGPGFALKPVKWLALGGTGKFSFARIDSFSAWALSFDGGAIYQPMKYLTLGASLLHLGTPRRFIADWEYPPVNLRAGAAFKLPIENHYILIAVDGSGYPDYGPNLSIGGEARLDITQRGGKQNQALLLRAGYQTGSPLGLWSGFSFGIGYEYGLTSGVSLAIDAVYLSYGILGDAERVSLGLKFTPVGIVKRRK
ncbi:MAG: PorV/PorQ family protein [candidate division WOR-3 bacterium]